MISSIKIYLKVQNFKSGLFIVQFHNIMIYSHAVNRTLYKGHPVSKNSVPLLFLLFVGLNKPLFT